MRRSDPISILLATIAVLLVGALVVIAVNGVIERHHEEHGHHIAKPHALLPAAQGSEAWRARESNDGGGVHGFICARCSLSTPLNPVAG